MTDTTLYEPSLCPCGADQAFAPGFGFYCTRGLRCSAPAALPPSISDTERLDFLQNNPHMSNTVQNVLLYTFVGLIMFMVGLGMSSRHAGEPCTAWGINGQHNDPSTEVDISVGTGGAHWNDSCVPLPVNNHFTGVPCLGGSTARVQTACIDGHFQNKVRCMDVAVQAPVKRKQEPEQSAESK